MVAAVARLPGVFQVLLFIIREVSIPRSFSNVFDLQAILKFEEKELECCDRRTISRNQFKNNDNELASNFQMCHEHSFSWIMKNGI